MEVPNLEIINRLVQMADGIGSLSASVHGDVINRSVPAAARIDTIVSMAATMRMLVDEVYELERGFILNREARP